MSMVKLVVDFENTSKIWWEEGGRDLWEGMLEGFDNHSVLLEHSIAESWLAEAAMFTVPSLVSRPPLLPAFAKPRSRSSSTALSISPSASPRARLQSIMPAPVLSRSALTDLADI